MPEYLQIGQEWINVDKLIRVHLSGDVADRPILKLFFSHGGAIDLQGDDAQTMLAYLRKHKAAE